MHSSWKHTTARVFVALVFASNVLCALQFLFFPYDFTDAYELQGPTAPYSLQALGIVFLMWNATYPPVIARPDRYRVLFVVVLVQQAIGLLGETLLLLQMDPALGVLMASTIRFIAFDAVGLAILSCAFLLTRNADERLRE